jgi:YD repeat-containing protein
MQLSGNLESTEKSQLVMPNIAYGTEPKYDRREQRILSESDEFSTQYIYMPTRQTESIIQDDKSVQYSYNAAGQRIAAKTPAVTSIYNYDGMGRLTKIDHQNITHY